MYCYVSSIFKVILFTLFDSKIRKLMYFFNVTIITNLRYYSKRERTCNEHTYNHGILRLADSTYISKKSSIILVTFSTKVSTVNFLTLAYSKNNTLHLFKSLAIITLPFVSTHATNSVCINYCAFLFAL